MRRAQAGVFVDALPAAGDPRKVKSEAGDLRGIPVIGPGVGGVSPGTAPESALGRLDRERDRRARARLMEPMVAFA